MKTLSSIYLRWQGYYDYTPDNVEKYVLQEPALLGIYKIAKLETYSRLTPFYINQSLDIYKSLINHFSTKEANKCLKEQLENYICCFRFAVVIEKEIREDVVRTLCDHYHPICNSTKPLKKSDLLINTNYQ